MKTQNNTIKTILNLHKLWSENNTTERAINILEALSFCSEVVVEMTPENNQINYEVRIKEELEAGLTYNTHYIEFFVSEPIKYRTKRPVYSSEELEALDKDLKNIEEYYEMTK